MLDLLIRCILVGLAGWRLASFLTYEDGPFSAFEALRRRVEAPAGHPEGFWSLLLMCIWCTSVWTATAMWLLWYLSPEIVALVAAWAVAVAFERRNIAH